MREDDESRVLGEVQTLDPFKDFPRNDTAPSGRCPGLCYSHPDPHQMAVRPSLLDPGVSPGGSMYKLCSVHISGCLVQRAKPLNLFPSLDLMGPVS